MFCEKCGNYVAEGNPFCDKCGASMSKVNGGAGQSQGNNYGYGQSDNCNTVISDYGGGVSGRRILKWVALPLAVLTFIFHLLNQYEISLSENYHSYYSDYSFSFGDFGIIATYAVVVFALYLGFLFVGNKNRSFDLVRRVLQIAFFAIMFLAPIIFVARMGSLSGEVNDLMENDYIKTEVSLKAGWWLTVMFGLVGLVVSFIPEGSSEN